MSYNEEDDERIAEFFAQKPPAANIANDNDSDENPFAHLEQQMQ